MGMLRATRQLLPKRILPGVSVSHAAAPAVAAAIHPARAEPESGIARHREYGSDAAARRRGAGRSGARHRRTAGLPARSDPADRAPQHGPGPLRSADRTPGSGLGVASPELTPPARRYAPRRAPGHRPDRRRSHR